jgi:uncharacterized coiled-coil DUF342 family protein
VWFDEMKRASLQAQLDAQQESINTLINQNRADADARQKLTEDLSSALKKIDGLDKQLASERKKIGGLDKQLGSERTKTDGLVQQLRSERTKTDGLVQQLGSERTKTDGLVQQLASESTKTDGLVQQLASESTKTDGLVEQVASGRKHSRSLAYAPMLNAYLNIIKYAQMAEPNAKKRRCSKQFQNATDPAEIKEYFRKADSLKDQRDRITHPRSVVELSDEARRYASMLEDHQNQGDVLDTKELMFVEVFSKIDDLRSSGIGNLVF